MVFKQENDPNFIMPLDDLIGNQTKTEESNKMDDELVGNLAFAEDIQNDSLSHIRSKMIVSQLNSILKSKNDVLKYEYIEMVRKGNEEELMKYLLSEHKDDKTNGYNDELEKKLRRKLVISNYAKNSQSFKSLIYENLLNKETQQIKSKLTSKKPKKVLEKIEMSIRAADRLLGSSIEYYEKSKNKQSKDREEGISSIYGDSDIFVARKYQKIVEQAHKREERINLAKIARENLKNEKQDEIKKNINKKSIEYKKKLGKIRIEDEIFNNKIKKMLICFNINLFVELAYNLMQEGFFISFHLNATIFFFLSKGLEYKRRMFQYNMKARILQSYFKKILVSCLLF